MNTGQKVFHLNECSIRNKVNDIVAELEIGRRDVEGITESWLEEDHRWDLKSQNTPYIERTGREADEVGFRCVYEQHNGTASRPAASHSSHRTSRAVSLRVCFVSLSLAVWVSSRCSTSFPHPKGSFEDPDLELLSDIGSSREWDPLSGVSRLAVILISQITGRTSSLWGRDVYLECEEVMDRTDWKYCTHVQSEKPGGAGPKYLIFRGIMEDLS
ncbi:uncharacterized protein LOC132400424 [Hypanus sabinus]|uniref:uncharacterized protein LOC132400424 n=1 Tax=Hypanus sabinus TaxID=79690 RepID=UPI0028C404A6|nr:uncharacterized protein LOC132400424 [Hypanus sabinus]